MAAESERASTNSHHQELDMAEKTVTSDSNVDKKLAPPFKRRQIPPKTSNSPSLSRSQSNLSNVDDSQQLELNTATLIPLTPLDSLPTLAPRGRRINADRSRREKRPYLANDDIPSFLEDELDLSRLNRIHGHLWMCGRPMRARPLHRYTMMGMSVLYTQQMDLHLLKFSSRLLLKPLPEWMLSYEFWDEYICPKEELHKSAAGFLLSYVWLITTPLDLKIAHDHTLLPSFVTWHWWKEFVRDFASNVDLETLEHVNKRYNFGDLRLGRINSIYRTRFFFTHYVRGYLYGYNRYTVFFQRNFSWILIVFVFFSLVLSAMQVGSGLNKLQGSDAFQEASYVFVVFSMASVAATLCLITLIFVGIFVFNMIAAVAHSNSEQAERKKKAKQKKSA